MRTRSRWLPVFSLIVAMVLAITHEAAACGSGGGVGEAATVVLSNTRATEIRTPFKGTKIQWLRLQALQAEVEAAEAEVEAARQEVLWNWFQLVVTVAPLPSPAKLPLPYAATSKVVQNIATSKVAIKVLEAVTTHTMFWGLKKAILD